MKKIITILVLACLVTVLLTGCTEADRVNENMRVQADNFNITRQITVFNTRTDTVLFQMTGLMSIQNSGHNELTVICEQGQNNYKKHFIYLGDDITYVVEDVTGAYADKYHYELNILPEMLIPVTVTSID